MAYNANNTYLYKAIHNQPDFFGSQAPPILNHCYITEDVPMSLAPSLLWENAAAFRCAACKASSVGMFFHHADYWRHTLKPDNFGIANDSLSELTNFVQKGKAY
jgi:opine dehydrogenase